MQEQGPNVEPEPRGDAVGRCEQRSFPEDTAPLIHGVLRAARAREELHAEVADRLHDKLVDHCLKAGMPDDPAAWLFKIACRECAKCEQRRFHLRRLEDVSADLVAPCAHSDLTEAELTRLRQEVLSLAALAAPNYQRTVDAALHNNWEEFGPALGTDRRNARRALVRATRELERIRDAKE